jgi:hypothetical protein
MGWEYVINAEVGYNNGEVMGFSGEKIKYEKREDFFEDLLGIMENKKCEFGIDFNSKCNSLLLKITETHNEYGETNKTVFDIKEENGEIKISEEGQTPFLPVDEYMKNYMIKKWNTYFTSMSQ